ncbi:MAG: ABC transporter ATP-binding protein [Kiritimatiellae bacterium]|nr:ABC transporter ATP-binding protein [Kiritimatiellia bacterium]
MIDIEHLSKNFGPVAAVKDLSLHVPWGELFCFLGPNGAGKTTTIKILCGLLKPSAGAIRVGGIDIHEDPLAARRITGYIPDHPFLYERLTPAEFFEFTGELYGVPRHEIPDRMRDAFNLFGLADSRNVLIKDLSHGFRQRIIYAATFLHEPRVLFIDEPLVGLDPYSIRLIKNLLREKAKSGVTVFLTTHILALAEDVADRIGIIDEGRLIAVGTKDELERQSEMKGSLEDVFLKLTE